LGWDVRVITGDFPRVRSAFLMSMRPLDDGQTLCEGIVLARRGRLPLSAGLSLWVRRLFTHGYLAMRRDGCAVHDTTGQSHASGQGHERVLPLVASLPQEPITNNPKDDHETNANAAPVARSGDALRSPAATPPEDRRTMSCACCAMDCWMP